MSNIKIKKGLDLPLKGAPEKNIIELQNVSLYAIKPDDFKNLTPKTHVKEGEKVIAGDAIFFDKYNEKIAFTSPVSGILKEIKRGERRKILEFVIESDSKIEYKEFKKGNNFSKEDIINQLLESGLWTKIIKRPFGTIPNPEKLPKAIHISTFDTNPLASDYNFTLKNDISEFQEGVNILSKLTDGKVHVNLNSKINDNIFSSITNAQLNYFEGPHPAGNVGTQIHFTTPINKGEIVWTVNPQDVVFIGRLFKFGKLDLSKIISVAGEGFKTPQYYKIISGCQISKIIVNNLNFDEVRIISGSVLRGSKIEKDSCIGVFDNSISVIKEGNYYEMFGWITPGFGKFSVSRTFFSWLNPKKQRTVDTNYHGGERAFVVTGEMEKVMPMDILPMHLVKACMIDDIDSMENLGIYEILEEDLALCEFVCTSKIEIQEIVEKSIVTMIKEME